MAKDAVDEFLDSPTTPTSSDELDNFLDSPSAPAASPQQGVFQGDSMAKDVLEAIPGYGAPSEFMAGVRSGRQLVSPEVLGPTLSGLTNLPGVSQILDYNLSGGLGVARALNTLFNPVGKTIGFAPKVAQATGAASGGDINAALQALTGAAPTQSAAEIPNLETGIPLIDVPAQTLSESINEAIVNQPLSLLGLTPRALAAQGTALRNFPANVATVAEQTANLGRRATAPLRSSAPVDPVAVEAAVKKVQDLEFQREQNRINTNKTAEARSAQDLILQEELVRAQQEASALGAEAMQANLELGPQIEALVRSSDQALGEAQGIRGRLPPPLEPSRFGTSVSQAIDEATGKARAQSIEDYSAVKEVLPESQPKIEASNLHDTATALSIEESAGVQSLGDQRINRVLKETSEVRTVDNISAEARQIYDNLPENQKQAFLDQLGGNLTRETRPTYTWDDLQKTYQRLNAKISEAQRNQDGNAVRVLTKLKEAVSEDMSIYAENFSPEAKVLFDEANAVFAANRRLLGTSVIGKITSDLASETPETIVNKIVGGEKASVVNNLKQVLSPEKFQEVQSQYANKLMSPSKDIPFDSNHFIKQFESINNETLKAVFGEDGFVELKKLDGLSKDAIKAQELQKTLDDFNTKAQRAEDAYQKARTSADEKRILDSAKSEAEAAIDSVKDQKFKRDIEKARADLKAAQTPQRVSIIIRALYGLLSFGTFAVSGAPVAGIVAGLAAAALGRVIQSQGRNIGSQISRAIQKK